MRGDYVDINIHGALTNTSYIAAREFINKNHLADSGRDTRDLIS
ncbi:MAG TPA: hypothetical protein VM532_04015 [Burkholderiales bacterium]|jgi:hypothetical protein|nr:hypothetical protein [Burkholderiales bacterium]